MNKSSAGSVVNYQHRSTDFQVGDSVVVLDGSDNVGKITRMYHAIGMADIEFSTGNHRLPVEDIKKVDEDDKGYAPTTNSTVGGEVDLEPFGVRDIDVSNPANSFDSGVGATRPEPTRVAKAWVKQSLYWAAVDRKYRATKSECGSHYTCPKCPDVALKKAIYKRDSGASEKLWGCPNCMFLIKDSDITRYDGGL